MNHAISECFISEIVNIQAQAATEFIAPARCAGLKAQFQRQQLIHRLAAAN